MMIHESRSYKTLFNFKLNRKEYEYIKLLRNITSGRCYLSEH